MHWVVVADASRARVFTAGVELDDLVEVDALVHPESRLKASEVYSDGMSRLAPGMKAEPHTAKKDHDREVFAREVAHAIEQHHGEFQRLILVAPPQFLGALRHELGPHGRAKHLCDVHKDLSGLAAHELPAAIKKHLPELPGLDRRDA